MACLPAADRPPGQNGGLAGVPLRRPSNSPMPEPITNKVSSARIGEYQGCRLTRPKLPVCSFISQNASIPWAERVPYSELERAKDDAVICANLHV